MFASLLHLFTPHHTNNHRPHILQPQGLAVLVGIFIFFHASIQLFAQIRGDVLGFASNITPDQVVASINAQRAERGLSTLTLNSQLTQAALMKASDIFTLNYWAHVNPNGRQPWDFFKAAGYQYRYAGENLARDFGDTGSMVAAWMASPTHRDNIINSHYTETGVAVVNGTLQGVETTLVVNLFGTPANRSLGATIQAPVQAAEPLPHEASSAVGSSPSPQPLVTATISQSTGASRPLVAPLLFEKVMAFSIVILLVLVLVWDTIHSRRHRLVRLVGKNPAHLLFIAVIFIIIILAKQGGVQ